MRFSYFVLWSIINYYFSRCRTWFHGRVVNRRLCEHRTLVCRTSYRQNSEGTVARRWCESIPWATFLKEMQMMKMNADFFAVKSGCGAIVCTQSKHRQTPSHPVRVKNPKEPTYLLFSAHAPDCRPPTYRWQTLQFSRQVNCKIIMWSLARYAERGAAGERHPAVPLCPMFFHSSCKW